MQFTKLAINIDEQIQLLQKRGMVFDDVPRAKQYLNNISYYRLRAYWMPFEVHCDGDGHAFRDGTGFDDVLSLYVFDRQLRLLVMDAVERVEVALRSRWGNHMATKYGPHGYLEADQYKSDYRHEQDVEQLVEEYHRSKDTFAEHYRETYTDPELPPVWMACELMSFGLLSKFMSNLRTPADRKAIAKDFAIPEPVLFSFAHHLSVVRNACAHHSRLWNRQFAVTMQVPKKYPAGLKIAMNDADERRLHNTLVMLDHMMTLIAPDTKWRDRLVALLQSCPLATLGDMGFADDWQRHAIWKDLRR